MGRRGELLDMEGSKGEGERGKVRKEEGRGIGKVRKEGGMGGR